MEEAIGETATGDAFSKEMSEERRSAKMIDSLTNGKFILYQYQLRRHDQVVADVHGEGFEVGPAGHGDVQHVD